MTRDRKCVRSGLKAACFIDVRDSADVVAEHLNMSRATVYNDVRQASFAGSDNGNPSLGSKTERKK